MASDRGKTGLGVSYDIAADIGRRVRSAREAQRKSTQAIATRIKVREHYLVAIEEGQWDDLPRGLNGRGLVRNYARELSVPVPELEPNVVRDFEAPHPYEVQHLTTQEYQAREVVKSIPRRPVFNETSPRVQPLVQKQSSAAAVMHAQEDIVTPDLSNLLGIAPEMLQEGGVEKTSSITENSDAPPVDAERLIEAMVSREELSPQEKRGAADEQTEEVYQELRLPVTAEAPHQHVETPTPAKEEPVRNYHDDAEDEVVLVETAQTQLDPSGASQEGQRVAQPLTPAVEHREITRPKARVASPTEKSSGKFVWFAAIGFLLLGGGVYLWLDDSRHPVQEMSVVSDEGASSSVSTFTASTATTGSDVSTAVEASSQVSTTASTEPAVASGAATDAQAAPVVTTQSSVSAVSDTVVETKDDKETDQQAQTSSTTPGETRSATLTISGDVDMRVSVDGKVLFSGKHSAGDFVINFKDRAEIFVRDGSLVSLSYEGWDHGPLGHSGRRRRIVLEASSAE